ncbi:MAG: hypothetical protein AAFX06_15550, partial [Planctomycetota bacterium]
MPHLYTCPHCNAKTLVEDRYSGQSGECFECGAAIQIPQFAAQATNATYSAHPGAAKRPFGVI